MKKDQRTAVFYPETIVLTAVFAVVIQILAGVFAASVQLSTKAEILTGAVYLAENAAEAVAASDSEEALFALLDENGNTHAVDGCGDSTFRARYDRERKPASGGIYRVDVSWIPAEDTQGNLVRSCISVYWNGEDEPVYTLETAVYIRPG